MNDTQQKKAAKKFAADWKGKGYEKDKANRSGFLCFVMFMA